MLTLPQTAEYALRAVCYVAEHEGNGPVPGPAIARALGAPRNYLSKTLHQLQGLGVLRSVRGVHGGYRLGQPANQVRLASIVEPFMPAMAHHCIMGHTRCRDDVPCGAHRRWKEVREVNRSFFANQAVSDLLEDSAAAAGRRDRESQPTPSRNLGEVLEVTT